MAVIINLFLEISYNSLNVIFSLFTFRSNIIFIILSKFLPTYMVPINFFYFKKFPITGNQGKINRPEIIKMMKDKIDKDK